MTINITDIIVNYGDIIELDFPLWDLQNTKTHLLNHEGWVQYNPRKSINRKGLSVTSLDGKYSGIPDLDSLREFNILNNTQYRENDFKIRTDIVNRISELNILLDTFPDHGRCHFLKLDAGGFFPPHRDNVSPHSVPSNFRLIVPINNFKKNQLEWIQNGSLTYFELGKVYFINTTKVHSIFSFVDNAICFVMNVMSTELSLKTLIKNLKVK
jgi:hypothetical protein